MIVFHATWQRVALCALLMVPVTLAILLMTPSWLVLPFFAGGRDFILRVCDAITEWVRIIAAAKSAKQALRRAA
ncbi:hypothetical protein [Nonomuraea insulae]|uniref:Uncharacterized protein n=1 Tax=Nonomuraea insulae TaxID=1616787 RepID=A0ABW1DDB5_9ACTN